MVGLKNARITRLRLLIAQWAFKSKGTWCLIPDRHSNDTADKQKEEEKKFKELGEAYSILSDSKKKARYDSGQDLDEMEGFGGFGKLWAESGTFFSFYVVLQSVEMVRLSYSGIYIVFFVVSQNASVSLF